MRKLLLLVVIALVQVTLAWADELQQLQTADFILNDAELPPSDDAGWQRQELPDLWRLSRPNALGNGWYRFRFDVAEKADPFQAVYVPKVVMNAAVYVNGSFIGDGGRFEEPAARNWNRPLLFLVPPGLLHPGENVLHVRVRNHLYTQAALNPLLIGPERLLRPEYERAYFLRITLNQTASLLIVAIGMLTLSLWWRRRQDTAYGYFGLSALVWGAQSVNLYVQNAPLPTAEWEILTNAGFQVFSGFLLISLLRYVAIHSRLLEAALWLSVVASPITLWMVPGTHYLALTAFWHFYTLSATGITLTLLFRGAFITHNRDARFLVGAMAVVIALAFHDWVMHSQHLWAGHVPWLLPDVYLLHYSAPVIFLAVGLIMTGRYVHILNQFELLNTDLESRVRTKHAELQDSYARMRELEMSHAVAEERERIYRDLHDDVGAKLLSLVYRANRPEDADLARSALRDLREVVSRTGADSFALDELAADWRSECEMRLREAGLHLEWQQSGALEGILLTQPQALDVGRILREAVTNTIRHAAARNVWVTMLRNDVRLTIEVRDDGIGHKQGDNRGSGRGIRNMEARAARLGADLLGRDTPAGGHIVALVIPCSSSGFAHRD